VLIPVDSSQPVLMEDSGDWSIFTSMGLDQGIQPDNGLELSVLVGRPCFYYINYYMLS
jgi:hypothetical protein